MTLCCLERIEAHGETLRCIAHVDADIALAAAVFTDADFLHLPALPYPLPTIEESDVSVNPGFSDYVLQFGHC